MRQKKYMLLLIAAIAVMFSCNRSTIFCYAAGKETDSLHLDELVDTWEDIQKENGSSFSLEDYISGVIEGEENFSFRTILSEIAGQLGNQLEGQKQTLVNLLILSVMSGIFLNFAGTIGDKNLSETGFYVIFLLLFGLVCTGFAGVVKVAQEAMERLLEFMKVLIPSFSLTLCLGSHTASGAIYYEGMLVMIGVLEMLAGSVFIPGTQVYFVLRMTDQLADGHFSKMAELVRSFLKNGIKLLFGIVVGYQGIQGMLFPVMDKVKNNTLLNTAKGLPGIGSSIGTVADTVVGSGMLIKSAVGAGGILCIVLICCYPLIKIFTFQLVYRIGAALVQPVSDKRIAAVLQTAAESGVLLMKIVFLAALLFLLSIVIVVVSTNLVS